MTRRNRNILIGGGGLLVLVAFLCLTKPPSPAGRYVVSSKIAAEGDFYCEIAEGKVSLVIHDLDTNGGMVTIRDKWGVYFETNGTWVYFSDRDLRGSNAVPVYLDNSWLGVSISATNGSSEFLRRRLIPFWRPVWMMDWLPWCIQ